MAGGEDLQSRGQGEVPLVILWERIMSGAFLLAVDNKRVQNAKVVDYFMGREMSAAYKALDKIAKKGKVKPLSAFVSLDEGDLEFLREEIEEGGGDPSTVEITPPSWFDPADGLQTVAALVHELSKDATKMKKGNTILSELRELEKALTFISKKKLKCRFFIDY
jgi:hypothetical protein